jgi:hypothetical protein
MHFAWSLVEHLEREGLFGMGPAYLGNRRLHPGHLGGPVVELARVEEHESEPSVLDHRISEAEAMLVQSTRLHHRAGTFAMERTQAVSVHRTVYTMIRN